MVYLLPRQQRHLHFIFCSSNASCAGPSIPADVLTPLVEALLLALKDTPRVCSKACFALHNFGDQFEDSRDAETNALSPYLTALVQELLLATQRDDGERLVVWAVVEQDCCVQGQPGKAQAGGRRRLVHLLHSWDNFVVDVRSVIGACFVLVCLDPCARDCLLGGGGAQRTRSKELGTVPGCS